MWLFYLRKKDVFFLYLNNKISLFFLWEAFTVHNYCGMIWSSSLQCRPQILNGHPCILHTSEWESVMGGWLGWHNNDYADTDSKLWRHLTRIHAKIEHRCNRKSLRKWKLSRNSFSLFIMGFDKRVLTKLKKGRTSRYSIPLTSVIFCELVLSTWCNRS